MVLWFYDSVLFSTMCVVTVVGNACMTLIISMDSKLHAPMYFFLKNLSILDICYSSVITLKAALTFSLGRRTISYNGFAPQMFFFSLFGTTEALLWWLMIASLPSAIHCSTKSLWIKDCFHSGGVLSVRLHQLHHPDRLYIQFVLLQAQRNKPLLLWCSCSDACLLLGHICQWNSNAGSMWINFCGHCLGVFYLLCLYNLHYCPNAFSWKQVQGLLYLLFSHAGHQLVHLDCFLHPQPGATSSADRNNTISILYTIAIPMPNPFIHPPKQRGKSVSEKTVKKERL